MTSSCCSSSSNGTCWGSPALHPANDAFDADRPAEEADLRQAPAADPSSGGVAVLDTTGNMLATQGRSTPPAVPGSSPRSTLRPADGPGRRPPRHLRRPAAGRAPPRGRARAGRWPSPPATTGTGSPNAPGCGPPPGRRPALPPRRRPRHRSRRPPPPGPAAPGRPPPRTPRAPPPGQALRSPAATPTRQRARRAGRPPLTPTPAVVGTGRARLRAARSLADPRRLRQRPRGRGRRARRSDRRRRPRRAPLPAGVGHEAAGEPGDPRGGRGGDAGSRRPGRPARLDRPPPPGPRVGPGARRGRRPGPSGPAPHLLERRLRGAGPPPARGRRPRRGRPTSTKRSSSRSASPPRRCPPAPPPPTGRTPAPPTSARVALELLEPTLVDPATLATATAPVFPELAGVLPGFGPQDPNPWGLGFEIRGHKNPHWTSRASSARTFGHFGRAGTFCWVDPVAGTGCVVLTDAGFGPWAVEAWPAFNDAVVAELG